MGFIYVITNQVNGKQYVGKTTVSIEERFQQHKNAAHTKNTVLYSAIRKYGTENFTIEKIEECNEKDLDAREQYWIDKLNTYIMASNTNGYNMTKGGDGGQGSRIYNYCDICEKYKELKNQTAVAAYFQCDIGTVKKALEENDIDTAFFVDKDMIEKYLLNCPEMSIQEIAAKVNCHPDSVSRYAKKLGINKMRYQKTQQAKPIYCIDIKTDEIVCEFPSIREAARHLGNINYSQNIGACCKKRQKTAYGYKWRYKDE